MVIKYLWRICHIRFANAKESVAKATRALTCFEKWFPEMLPKALQMLARCVTVPGNYSEGRVV
jgi:hypothetical protein